MNNIQQQVQEAIDGLVESGAERGLQVAVYQHGDLVADAVAGIADPATGRPVTSDTPFYAYSTGKGATATVAHMLVERGAFGYDTPIVELWPEFGAHGKERATVRHALTHGRRTRHTGRHDARGPVRLGQDVRRDRRLGALVGAGDEDCLSRLHVRLYRRGDRAPGHRQAHLAGPAGGCSRTAGRCRRTLLRRSRVRAGQAGPSGGRGRQCGISRRAARRFAVLQVGTAGDLPDRRVRQPRRRVDGRHPRRGQDVRARWRACTPRCWARWTACG